MPKAVPRGVGPPADLCYCLPAWDCGSSRPGDRGNKVGKVSHLLSTTTLPLGHTTEILVGIQLQGATGVHFNN